MSIDSYLQSAIVRTSLGDHGLAAWYSGYTGPLVNETGTGTLEAVLLWRAIPDPGQEDSEYPSGTVSFKRNGIDTDFSETVHVPNMWRAASLLGIGYNWEYTAENHPEAAAWLKNNGPLPVLDAASTVVPEDQPGTRKIRFSYRRLLRKHAAARSRQRDRLLGLLGPEWAVVNGVICCNDVRIRVAGHPTWMRYVTHVAGARVIVQSVKDLKIVLRRLGMPVKVK